jgi:hypothetical protein
MAEKKLTNRTIFSYGFMAMPFILHRFTALYLSAENISPAIWHGYIQDRADNFCHQNN